MINLIKKGLRRIYEKGFIDTIRIIVNKNIKHQYYINLKMPKLYYHKKDNFKNIFELCNSTLNFININYDYCLCSA